MRVISRKVIYYQGRPYLREVCKHPGAMCIFARGCHVVMLTGCHADMWVLRPRLHEIRET